jgi:hypothetical protein
MLTAAMFFFISNAKPLERMRCTRGTLRCAAFEYVGQWTENKMEGKG